MREGISFMKKKYPLALSQRKHPRDGSSHFSMGCVPVELGKKGWMIDENSGERMPAGLQLPL